MRMQRRSAAPFPIAAAVLAGLLCAGVSVPAAETPQPASSCVACHTDQARLQEEAKGIPIPAASPLQAGKG